MEYRQRKKLWDNRVREAQPFSCPCQSVSHVRGSHLRRLAQLSAQMSVAQKTSHDQNSHALPSHPTELEEMVLFKATQYHGNLLHSSR